MATSESLNISMTSASGRKQSRAITNISPNATTDELNTFAQNLVDLTTNTLVATSKITKEDLSYDYDLTFTVQEAKTGTGLITKVDNNTYTVNKSKIQLTTVSDTDANCIQFMTKAGNYNIFNNIKDKMTFTFHRTADDAISPTITILYADINGEAYWELYLYISPSDEEFLDELAGFKLVVHIPSGTIGGDKTYAPADLTFNFV